MNKFFLGCLVFILSFWNINSFAEADDCYMSMANQTGRSMEIATVSLHTNDGKVITNNYHGIKGNEMFGRGEKFSVPELMNVHYKDISKVIVTLKDSTFSEDEIKTAAEYYAHLAETDNHSVPKGLISFIRQIATGTNVEIFTKQNIKSAVYDDEPKSKDSSALSVKVTNSGIVVSFIEWIGK